MTIDNQQRILDWEGAYNARDLGGYRTEDGRETRWERLVRSDNLIRLTSAGRRALEEHGVKTIIDLRLPQELEIDPPPFRDHESIAYHHLSFVDPSTVGQGSAPERLADDYVGMIERFAPRVGEVMRTIANAPEGGVLFHCHAGKDRTGVIAAFLLRLAGVPIETAAEDYALTRDLLRPVDEEWLENGSGTREWREKEYERTHARAEVMAEVLERVEAQHGSIEGYLLDAGVTQEEIEKLRERLLG